MLIRKYLWLASPILSVIGMVGEAFASPLFTITTDFGEIDSVHKVPHKGIDLAMPVGTPIKSIVDGVVSSVSDTGHEGFGKSVRIVDGHGHTLILGHLSKILVHKGEHISMGELVALSGSTGHSTGPHLHLQVNINGKPVNPMPLMTASAAKKALRELLK